MGSAYSDTIVVCRPNQLCEAAIVVSCLPSKAFVPVISVEAPPMSVADYIQRHQKLTVSLTRSEEMFGGPLGSAEVMAATRRSPSARREVLAALDRSIWMQEAIAPYQSWLKHNEMVSQLLADSRVSRAIFLFDPDPGDLYMEDPSIVVEWNSYRREADGKGPGEPKSMFASLSSYLYLLHGLSAELDNGPRNYFRDLPDLARRAWSLLRDEDPPRHFIEVAGLHTANYLVGLFAALRSGLPLRPVDHCSRPIQEVLDGANPDADASEAVLVEDTGHASTLLGALYAHHRAARLVVTPPPVLDEVQHAVAARQDLIVKNGRGIFDGIRSRISGESRRDQFVEIEAAVTAQVPHTAVREVGDRRLTAFTIGLPYSFVKTIDDDWSRKPIGHVAADPTLIILNEIFSTSVELIPAAVSLIFDPGYFRTSETADVMRQVSSHFTHSILLDGEYATALSLMHLSDSLPVELVFFNTHGSDESIVLSDMPVPRRIITRFVKFPQRPIVFNNSCQSWTSIGREFVRIGARGYIGTLWSIPSDLAADFARTVMHRVTTEEAAACQAMVSTGLSETIERSYIYVGTANGRLNKQRGHATGAQAALAACAILLRSARKLPNGQLTRLVCRETEKLRNAINGSGYDETSEYLDILLGELEAISKYPEITDSDLKAANHLADSIDSSVERIPLPETVKKQKIAQRYAHTGTIYYARHRLSAALADLLRSIQLADTDSQRAYLQLAVAEILTSQGNWDEAMTVVTGVRDFYSRTGDRDGLIKALGLLGQIARRLGRDTEALQYAQEGYHSATSRRR